LGGGALGGEGERRGRRFDVPTTAARFGDRLYQIQSRR
jgi:hypothetical protein